MRRPAIVATMALFAAVTPAAAQLAPSGIGSNYTFPDGSAGFDLGVSLPAGNTTLTSDGLLLPAVLVEFNPQPDPPGTPPTFLSLTDPTKAMFTNTSTGPYAFVMSFLNLLPDGCDTTIPVPNSDGNTSFSCTGTLGDEADVTVDVLLTVAGPLDRTSWSSFNPQPDPPGAVTGDTMTFQADPSVTVSINVDDTPLDFSVPEPGTLSLFGTALVGLAAWRRRQRRS